MRFQFNPFTDKLDISGTGPGATSVDFLTGNSGGIVAADASYNIFVLGNNASGINTVGNGSPNTLTIFGLASSTTQIGTTRYATNAEAAAQTIGTAALTPSNITSLFSTHALPSSQGGTGLSSPAAHQLIVTNGSSPYTALGVASNGQIPIGSIGSNPVLATITAGSGVSVTNGPGTITIGTSASGFPISPYVVGPVGQAGYQTIQSALNAAFAAGGGTVYVQPGTYTENLTLYDNTQVVGAVGLADTGDLIIVGVHVPPASGGFIFRNVTLQSATHIFNSAVAGSAHLIIIDAAIIVTNGYTFNLPNWTGKLESFDVNDRGSTNDGYVNNTGGAEVALFSCAIGAGSGHVMTVSGSTSIFTCAVNAPLNCVTGSSVFLEGNVHLNTITFSNNSTGEIVYSEIDAQITMSSSAAWLISETTINTSANPAIDGSGAGTLTLGGITFVSGNNISGSLTIAGSTGFLPTVMTDGQLLIGKTNSGAVASSLTSGGGTITITTGPGTINLETAGGGGGITTINGDSGSVTGATIAIITGNSTQNSGATVAFTNSGTTSTLNLTDGNDNTLIGKQAGNATFSGIRNNAFGSTAGVSLTSGNSNNFFGYAAGNLVNSGGANNLFGSLAGTSITTGSDNVFMGQGAGQSLQNGNDNTMLGYGCGQVVTSGSRNIIIGSSSGNAYTTSESSNILVANAGVIGESNVMRLGTTGSGNGQVTTCFVAGVASVTVPNTEMVTIDTTTGQLGSQAVPGGGGITTLSGDISGSATGSTVSLSGGRTKAGSSVGFTASGSDIAINTTDSSQNTFLGASSGGSSTTGNNNVGLGYSSLQVLGSGSRHVGVGSTCLASAVSSINNTAVGFSAGLNLDGDENVLLGYQCAKNFDTGSNNIIIGVRSGNAYTTSESNNIVIGNLGVVAENHTIRIGDQGAGFAQQNTCFIAGIHNATVTGAAVLIDTSGQLGDISSSIKVKENVQDFSKTPHSILNCRPVSFTYKSDKNKTKCFGLIAEEVEKVFPDLVLYKDGQPYSVKYHEMPALLLGEIQKLRKEIADLRKSIL